MSEGIPNRGSSTNSTEASSLEKTYFLKKLEEPAIKAFNKLRSDIESGSIGSIIGIDASGRVPALLAREVISSVYEQKGIEATQTRFFAGRANWESVRDHLEKHPLQKERKVLVVDDTLITGNSIEPIIQALDALGYKSEVLTIHGGPLNETNSESRVSFPRPLLNQTQLASVDNAQDKALSKWLSLEDGDPKKELAGEEWNRLASEYIDLQNISVPIHNGSEEDNSPLTNRNELSGVVKEGGVWGSGIKTEGIHAVSYKSPEVPLVRKEIKELAKKITSSWF